MGLKEPVMWINGSSAGARLRLEIEIANGDVGRTGIAGLEAIFAKGMLSADYVCGSNFLDLVTMTSETWSCKIQRRGTMCGCGSRKSREYGVCPAGLPVLDANVWKLFLSLPIVSNTQ